METGKLIKELRLKRGMTQEELAGKTEVSARTIQLMVWVGILAGLWIYWNAHVPIPLILLFLFNAVMSIVNTVRVVSGEPYKTVSFFKSKDKDEKTK